MDLAASQPLAPQQPAQTREVFSPEHCKNHLLSASTRVKVLGAIAAVLLLVALVITLAAADKSRPSRAGVYFQLMGSVVLAVMVAFGAVASRVSANAPGLMALHVVILLILLTNVVFSFMGLAEEGPGKEHAYHLVATLVIAALLIAVFFVFQKHVQPGIDNNSTLLGAAWPSMRAGGGGDWTTQLRAKFDATKAEIGEPAQHVQFNDINPLPSIAELGRKYQTASSAGSREPATVARGFPSTATASLPGSAPISSSSRADPVIPPRTSTARPSMRPASAAIPSLPTSSTTGSQSTSSTAASSLSSSTSAGSRTRRPGAYFTMTGASMIPAQPRPRPETVIPAGAPPRSNPTLAGLMSAAHRSTQPALPSRPVAGLDDLPPGLLAGWVDDEEEEEETDVPQPLLLAQPPRIPRPAQPYMPTIPPGATVVLNPMLQTGSA